MLSPEELKIAEFGKAQGKTREQVMEAISKFRATQAVATKETPQPTDTVGGDISSAFTSGIDYINQGRKEAGETNNPIKKTEAGLKMVGGALQSAFSPLAPVTKYLGKGVDYLADKISENKGVQDFAMSDAGKMTARIAEDVMNTSAGLSVVGGGKGVRAGAGVASDTLKSGLGKLKTELTPTAEQIAKERQVKMTQGLSEQNVRLKSADRAFNKNTINRPTPDGKKITITPIDTFVKYNIAPVIEKGSIQMGDYKLGSGELGKIKTKVSELDTQIESKMKGNTTPISIDEMEFRAFEKVMKNEDFRLSGTVSANVAKLEAKFKDFKNTYGETLSAEEVNKMRKNANYDFNPETMDISRIIGDTSRDYVYKASPEAQKLLLEQGELLSAKKYAEAINGTKVTGGKIGNYVMRTVGAGIGSTVQQLPVIGPVLGMIGGEFVARGMQQAQFKSLWTELRALLAKEATDQK
jgi:hypothetical protein